MGNNQRNPEEYRNCNRIYASNKKKVRASTGIVLELRQEQEESERIQQKRLNLGKYQSRVRASTETVIENG